MAFLKKQSEGSDKADNLGGFEQIYSSFLSFLEDLGPSKRKVWALVSLIVAVTLTTLASFVPVILSGVGQKELSMWVSVLIGFPAGLIVFGNLAGVAHFTRVKDWGISQYKERYPQSRRMRDSALISVLIIATLIVAGGKIPQGLGGIIVITLALFAYNTIRRTPDELKRAQLGLPDPREIKEENNE